VSQEQIRCGPQEIPIKCNTHSSNIGSDIFHNFSHAIKALTLGSKCTGALESNEMTTQPSSPNLSSLLPSYSDIITHRHEPDFIPTSLCSCDRQSSIEDIASVIAANNQCAFALRPISRLTHPDGLVDLCCGGRGENVAAHVGGEVFGPYEASEHGFVAAAAEADGCDMVVAEGA